MASTSLAMMLDYDQFHAGIVSQANVTDLFVEADKDDSVDAVKVNNFVDTSQLDESDAVILTRLLEDLNSGRIYDMIADMLRDQIKNQRRYNNSARTKRYFEFMDFEGYITSVSYVFLLSLFR